MSLMLCAEMRRGQVIERGGESSKEEIQSRQLLENNLLYSGTFPLEERCQMDLFTSVLTLEALED